MFQCEEPGWIIEGLQRSSELGWYDRWQHAYIERAFGSFGELRTETVTDATPGMAAAFARDLDAFGDFLRQSQGASESDVAAQLDLRRRGLEAPDLSAAAAAGRQWQAERDRTQPG